MRSHLKLRIEKKERKSNLCLIYFLSQFSVDDDEIPLALEAIQSGDAILMPLFNEKSASEGRTWSIVFRQL